MKKAKIYCDFNKFLKGDICSLLNILDTSEELSEYDLKVLICKLKTHRSSIEIKINNLENLLTDTFDK